MEPGKQSDLVFRKRLTTLIKGYWMIKTVFSIESQVKTSRGASKSENKTPPRSSTNNQADQDGQNR